MFDISSGKIKDFIKFDVGNLAVATGGHNAGRVGVITNKEKHKGAIDIIHIRDAAGHSFATRVTNIFVIGKGDKPLISLPKGKGIRCAACCDACCWGRVGAYLFVRAPSEILAVCGVLHGRAVWQN